MNSLPLSLCSEAIAKGKPPAISRNAFMVAFDPLFQHGAIPIHCVLLSTPIRIQRKLSEGSPPPRAKVSTWTSPGAVSQAIVVSPDRQGTDSFRPPPLRPERLLETFSAQSDLAFPLSSLSIVEALMRNSFPLTDGGMTATWVS